LHRGFLIIEILLMSHILSMFPLHNGDYGDDSQEYGTDDGVRRRFLFHSVISGP
jgi:hypothetical protein